MQLSALVSNNAANVAAIADGDWGLIANYGDHPSPDKRYIQKFPREQAEKVVKTWNSITGTAARVFKNLWHGLGAKSTCPVWDGHPETDKRRWPIEQLLAEITDLRLGEGGLEGRLTWNDRGLQARTKGPLYPSSLWWHWPPNEQKNVFPELLESVGLVPTPNISGVPAWTLNATLASEVEAQSNANQKPMNEEQLKALRKALNLGESDDVAKVIETAQKAYQLSTSNATALQTANSEKTKLENDLTTANAKAAALATEKTSLTTANGILIEGILDLFQAAGKFTAAERNDVAARFTANVGESAKAIIVELKEKKPALNTKVLELNGNRIDLSTANARQEALETAIAAKQKELNTEDRGKAYDAVRRDPKYKQLFEAMSDPTKAKAA